MRWSIAALALAGLAGCGAPQGGRPAAPPVEPTATARPALEATRGELDAALTRLEERHRVQVSILATAVHPEGDARVVFVAYSYRSYDAWRVWRSLESWEREAAEWSADPEYEVWTSGLESSAAGVATQQTADERFAACTAGVPGCDEVTVWDLAREDAAYAGCGDERIGLARLSFLPDAAPTLDAALVVDGRRCAPDVALTLADLDGDGEPALAVETLWSDGADEALGLEDAEHVALLVVGLDLTVQLWRRLCDLDDGSESSEPAPYALYWAEDVDGDGAKELVIERFGLEAPCDPGPCRPNAGRPARTPPCFPLSLEPRVGCRRSQVERAVLSFDRERRLWL